MIIRNARRPARRSLCIALGLTLSAATSSLALAQTAVVGPGLQSGGSISYDAEGVPTITAGTDEDAAWLMGYAHARDRFFQMDLLRRTASGTLAELVGASVLPQDVEIRTLGLRRAAWETWAKISPELSGQLKSYSDGVNAWLAANPVPREHQALELSSADRWTPVDSLSIGKLLAFQLSFDLEIDYTLKLGAYQQAGTAGGFNGTRLFFEDTHRIAPPDGRISIAGFGAAKAEVTTPDVPDFDAATLGLAQSYLDRIADNPVIAPHLKRRENRAGSNWWMVGGQHTASGRPILANDPHLSLDTPMLFHEGHVISTDPRYATPMNSVGSIAPGTPWPILGCTSNFCWGLTTNSLDVTDTYLETFVLNSYGLPTHTIHGSAREPVLWVFQSYFVNRVGDGVANNVTRENSIGYTNGAISIIVPRRNNGPVVELLGGNQGLSIAYTGWGPTFELEAFRKINRATNLEQFRTAVLNFDVGSQNFGYVDKAGNFAYFMSAEMPIREDLQNNTVTGAPPYLIRNGGGGNEWLRATNRYPAQALPFEILGPQEMPFTINPAQGYIANANNDPIGTTLDNNPLNQVRAGGGLLYYAPGHSAYRMGRIDREMQKLVTRGGVTVADMQKLQANTQLLDAELVLPHLLQAWDNGVGGGNATCAARIASAATAGAGTPLADAIKFLEDWDYSSPTGIRQGFDAGDNPAAMAEPGEVEIANSVAATVFAMWRGQVIRNTIDATLTAKGLGAQLPGGTEAYSGLKYMLDTFAQNNGRGGSGLDFFAKVPADASAETPAQRRDCILLTSLQESLARLASNEFTPAFANSTTVRDYRWGKLHRIVFDHPLGSQLSIPGAAGYPFTDVATGLPGLARQGGHEAVDASSHNARANTLNGFMFGGGPIRRFIGEMTDTPTLLHIAPGGQDGKIGGPGYVSQLSRWLVNAYKPLVIDPAVSQSSETTRLNFVAR